MKEYTITIALGLAEETFTVEASSMEEAQDKVLDEMWNYISYSITEN